MWICQLCSLFLISFSIVSLGLAEVLPDAQISEFLANNGGGIVDEDGDREDWIEIWNTSGVVGDLEGWYLTDDPLLKTKWKFPSVEMTSGGYLVVFASGKDRVGGNGEIHTNFKLQQEAGGYLALVKPDGVTVVSEFSNYPAQSEDIAYGVSVEEGRPLTFFSAGAQAKWIVPSGPIDGWMSPDFDDSGWRSGATGIGFDSSWGDYLPLLGAGGDVKAEMAGINASIYIRIPFEVLDPAGISNLNLSLKWEDGFVAYLNGTEFHRESAPQDLSWNSSASDGNRDESNAVTFFNYPVTSGGLVEGTNVLSIHGLNQSAGSSDLLFVPEFAGIIQDAQSLTTGFFTTPSPGGENGIRYNGIVADTKFSVNRGVYQAVFNLEITTKTEGAVIRYTTDGSEPTESKGLIYDGPIVISETTVVRAMAFKEGFRSTNVDTHSYIFPAKVLGPNFTDALTAVPTISVVAQPNYDLRLMSVSSTSELPSATVDPPARSQIVVALVGGSLHVRVIDVNVRRNRETNTTRRSIVADKSEGNLVNEEFKAKLLALLNKNPFPQVSDLSPEEVREIVDQALIVANHDPRIPIFEDSNNDYLEHKASVEMIYPDGRTGFQEYAGLLNFGGGFTNFPKKSFRLNFRKEYGAGKLRHPIFDNVEYDSFHPVEKFDAFDLRSGSHDMQMRGAYMAARFVDDSMLEMGQIAPHGRYVHVYLNGQYWGQYHLRERWGGSMAASYFGGQKEDYDAIRANNSGSEFQTGTPYDGTAAFWTETRNLLNGADPFTNAANHLDIANVIDFMLLWTSGECESEFRAFGSRSQNVPFKFMVRDPDGFMPNGSWNHDHPVTHNGPLSAMTRLRNGGNKDYNVLLADRIHKHFFNGGALSAEKSVERLRKRFLEMEPGFAAEAQKWGFQSVNSWKAYVNNWLNNGLPQRTASMIQRLKVAGMYPDITAPVLSQHGGSVSAGAGITMSTNASAVYYTLDGSDPRLPGGGINPTAIQATFAGDIRDPEDFIASGDVWKFLDDGSDQTTLWRQVDYDDSTWASGPSQLGYGDVGLATIIGYVDSDPERAGTQKNATTYFRKKVTIESPSDFSNFVVGLRYDDGAAVYVNGVEVLRTATLPVDASFDTYTNANTPSESIYYDFVVPSSRFVDGVNTVAVEVHNANAGNSDVRFDLTLRGEIDLSNGSNVTKPVVFNEPSMINARSFDSGSNSWSPVTSTFFAIDTIPASSTNLVISELHYRPAEAQTAAEIAVSSDRDEFEFIELLNVANQPIDLSGVYFDDGISFYFAEHTILEPGGRIVLVENQEAFKARYPQVSDGMLAGQYTGSLSNDGERIVVRRKGGEVLIDLTYNDQLPWPVLADGLGYSMIFTGDDQTSGSSWAAHSVIGGAPGEEDGALVLGYAEWKLVYQVDDDLSDTDGDGFSAFAEYAMGTDPTSFNQQGFGIGGQVQIDANGFLTITYQQGLLVSDVTFAIEESTDLKTWTQVDSVVLEGEIIDAQNQTKRVTQRLPILASDANLKFIRVHMTR